MPQLKPENENPKNGVSKEKDVGITDKIENILSKPTGEVADEAIAVTSFAIEESKTAGGLFLTIATIWALIAASPWSWIAALLFGPARVWATTQGALIAGIGTTLGLVLHLFLILSFVILIVVGIFIYALIVK
jgi:hypothetical protein